MDTSSLNANQLNAVNWGEGPLLVCAGPGSGKTNVLTYRIVRLIEGSEGKSFRILGLTFTNKAVAEMRKRVRDLVPNSDERITLTTFHSFSATILRQHGHHIGISPDFAVLSQETERMAVLDKAIAKAEMINSEGYTSERLLPLVTTLTDQNIAIEKAAEVLQEKIPDSAQHIGKIYKYYRQLMIENNELDYGALVAEALKLLTQTPVGKLVRRIYPYVCVDEFQDTTLAQYQVLCSIVDPSTKNLFVVADNDQIIYEWNGASPERIIELQKHFDMTVLELPENYRCPPEVVEMANKLISNNISHSRARSVASKDDELDHIVRVETFDTAEEEADWVARDIAKRSVSSRGNCVILAKTRIALKMVVDALEIHGLHGHLYVRKDEFTNDQMAWLHSVLRLADSKQNSEQLRRVCKSFCTMEGCDLIVSDIISEAVVSNGDYLRAWARTALREQLNSTTRSFLEISVPKLVDRLDFNGFISDCFKWFERRQETDATPDYKTEYEQEKKIWETLVAEATYDIGREKITLSALLQHMDLHSKEPPAPKDAIPCYTIHASKGMGFDHVYLIRLSEGELPDWRVVKKDDTSSEMQEERRICFVAITRAQKSLTLTCPQRISGYKKQPSRFLAEMGIE